MKSLVAITEPAEEAEDTHTDYRYDVPEDFEVAPLGYQSRGQSTSVTDNQT